MSDAEVAAMLEQTRTMTMATIGPDGMPFPVQAMTAGADGVEDSASVRRHGFQRQGLAGFGQGLRIARWDVLAGLAQHLRTAAGVAAGPGLADWLAH